MARPEKEAAVRDIAERLSGSSAALLTEYRGLRVGELADVRNSLREAGADYKVLKNTLTRIAAKEVGLEDLAAMLTGPTAVVFVQDDAAAAAKALDQAAQKYPVLVIKGGVLKGQVIDAGQTKELARLEPREVQLAKIAMLLNQPAQRTVNVFAALLRDLGSMLAQVVEKKERGEIPEAGAAAQGLEEPSAGAPSTTPDNDSNASSEAAGGGKEEE